MAIQVNPNNILLASVSYVELEAKQSFVDLQVQTSSVDVEVSASYIDVGVSANVSMPDVLSVDIVTPVDEVNKHTTKKLQDVSEGFVDQQFKLINKVLADIVFLEDVAIATKIYFRTFVDSANLPDSVALNTEQGTTEETANVVDNAALGLNKPFFDGVLLNDDMDGELDFFIFKVVADSTAPIDVKVVDFQPVKADNVSISSSGILALQDYCDITYFLEDYVGISRAIT